MTLVMSRAHFEVEPPKRTSAEYAHHQVVADLFGDREDRGYLYRVTERQGRLVTALILSRDEPDASARPMWGSLVELRSRRFRLDVPPQTWLDFEVRVNATRVQTVNGRKVRRDIWDAEFADNRETPATPVDIYRSFLAKKLDGAATIDQVAISERRMIRAVRGDGRHVISFVATNIVGRLRVTSSDSLEVLMADGIGRARSFGCGMLCLSRPGTVLRRRWPAQD